MIGIKFGKIERETIHLCIDMQRIFLEPSPWFCQQGVEILEPILALIRHQPYNSWFSQFMTPNNSNEMENSWERYYEYWKPLTQDHLEKGMLDIHQGLFQESSTPQIFEKFSYDSFKNTELDKELKSLSVKTLIMTGVETDVCVLATVFSAVDLGYRVIMASDAMTSSDLQCHDFVLNSLTNRFDQQIEVASVDEILEKWK